MSTNNNSATKISPHPAPEREQYVDGVLAAFRNLKGSTPISPDGQVLAKGERWDQIHQNVTANSSRQ